MTQSELDVLITKEGIDYWGIAKADLSNEGRELAGLYRQWISEKRHGTMHYLEVHEDMKYTPFPLLTGLRSILVFAMSYFPGHVSDHSIQHDSRTASNLAKPRPADVHDQVQSQNQEHGRISIYACVRDYHREFTQRIRRIMAKLKEAFPNENFRSFTDSTPLHERTFAEGAGICFTGKNTLSLNRELGSYFFIGEILTSKYFPPRQRQVEADGHCPSSCRRCIDVCPTGALESPFRIDASKCISYLTIEHKGIIPIELRKAMGNWIFGCDLCQEVCPFNVRARTTKVEAFQKPIIASRQNLVRILALKNHEEFTAIYAGTPVMRAGWVSLIRNAIIAAANTKAESCLAQIRNLCKNSNPIIAETAKWALGEFESLGEHFSEVREN